jgi:hypothetical protein
MTAPQLCACGCGQPTPIAKRTDRRRGLVKGEPTEYVRGHAGSARARVVRQIRAGHPAEPRPQLNGLAEIYAEQLLHQTKLIVGAIRFHGPDEVLRQVDLALAMEQPPGIDPAVALAVVLAAQIDPDTTDEQRLGWVRAFDPEAAPQAAPTPPRQLPVRASPRKENAA